MKNTVTAIKADIGDIGGHFAPSQAVLTEVKRTFDEKGKGLISDHSIGHTGGRCWYYRHSRMGATRRCTDSWDVV